MVLKYFSDARITQKIILPAIAAFLLILSHAAVSESGEAIVLTSADIKPYKEAIEGFKKTCGCSVRVLSLNEREITGIPEQIRRLKPDAVFAVGAGAFSLARTITELPVIYAMVPHTNALRSISDNISGVSMNISPERYLNTMAEILPGAKRIGVVYDPRNTEVIVSEALRIAGSRGIELVLAKTERPEDVPSLVDSMKNRIDILWMLPDPTVVSSSTFEYMLLFSFRNRVPLFAFADKYAEMGALASLSVVPSDIGMQAGEIMNKIIHKVKQGDPVRSYARKTALKINSRIADRLGIKISDEVRRKAEDVK